ncbi:hypothetical protein [Acinetobacter nosocomialis]
MVRIFCAVSMVLAIAMGMSACQDRNSRNDPSQNNGQYFPLKIT